MSDVDISRETCLRCADFCNTLDMATPQQAVKVGEWAAQTILALYAKIEDLTRDDSTRNY